MNDDRYLRDWLRDSTDASSDPNATADRVVARLPETPQRARWWPWWSRRRATPDTPRRTRFMLSPSSAVVAASLAIVFGAAFLIAQPLSPEPVVPAAEGDAAHASPVEVSISGRGGSCSGGSFKEDGIKVLQRGSSCAPTLEADDARLSGTVTYASNQDRYTDDSHLIIDVWTISIENDDGAWRSRPIYWLEYPGAAETQSDVWVLEGEDAYEGLTAVLIQDGFYGFHGFIVDGELPPVPGNGSAL